VNIVMFDNAALTRFRRDKKDRDSFISHVTMLHDFGQTTLYVW